MSESTKQPSTKFDANVCPFCNKGLRGDPRICPHCRGVLRFTAPWWDLGGGLGFRVVGAGILCLCMLVFAVYSGMMAVQTQVRPAVSQQYMVGAVIGGVGTLVFLIVSWRSYKMG